MKPFKISALFFGFSLLFFSCSKDGATGPTGASGTNGINGTNGTSGNANVKTTIFTVSSWTPSTNYYYCNLMDPDLTTAIQDSGNVSVFYSIDAGGVWNDLPTQTSFLSTGYHVGYNYVMGKLVVYWAYNNGGAGAQDMNAFYSISSIQFKVICTTASGMKKYPGTNWNHYNEVKQILPSQD